ncbi:MAG TPA: potassium transporter TrkG, partial [Nitrospiraceae bacterium]|nr:potassium transporter TrkG [Nitrospiraceae bacterium]
GKAVLIVLAGAIAVTATLLWIDGTYPTTAEGFRHSVFNVVSIATTTGFVTEDYEKWPAFLPVWLIFLSCITCSTGSTGGGIKMFRPLLLWRQAARELRLLVHPSAVVPVRIGGRPIPDRVGDSVLAFIFLYFMTNALLTFALLLTGLDFESAFSAIVASINNAGPGLGAVGPVQNYQSLTDVQTWICTAGMLLGRLEIFSVLVLFTPTFWRK